MNKNAGYKKIISIFLILSIFISIFSENSYAKDKSMLYEVPFSIVKWESGGNKQIVKTDLKPVKVVDNCMLVDLNWIAEWLGIYIEEISFDSGIPSDSLWVKSGVINEENLSFSNTEFKIKKNQNDSFFSLLCVNTDVAITYSPYMGVFQTKLGSNLQFEELENGEKHFWVPLYDILFLCDSSATIMNNTIEINECSMSAVDILHRKDLNKFYCNIFDESGLCEEYLRSQTQLYELYKDLNNLFGNIVSLDFYSYVKDLFPETSHIEAGKTLALELCSASTEEYDKINDLAISWLDCYSITNPLVQNIAQKVSSGYLEKGSDLLNNADELFEKIKGQLRSAETDILFKDFDRLQGEGKKLLQNSKWFKAVAEKLEETAPAIDIFLSSYFKYSLLATEINSTNLSYTNCIKEFIERYSKDSNIMIPGVLIGIEERLKYYEQKGNIDFTSDTFLQEQGESMIEAFQTLETNSNIGLKMVSDKLLPYQVIYVMWELIAEGINEFTGGIFDSKDCLELSLYGMGLESSAYDVYVKYKNSITYEGSVFDPHFNDEQLKFYTSLSWSYLKTCYITRQNMIGIFQTHKNDTNYDYILEDSFKTQKEICELMAVLMTSQNFGEYGITPSSSIAHSEKKEINNEYLLSIIRHNKNGAFNPGFATISNNNIIYYCLNNGLYMMDIDNNEINQLVSNLKILDIDCFDNYLYFIVSPFNTYKVYENTKIYRMNLNTKETNILINRDCYQLMIYDNHLYYTSFEDKTSYIYRSNLNGEQEELISIGSIQNIDNNYLTCCNDAKFYLLNLDTLENKELSYIRNEVYYYNDHIYTISYDNITISSYDSKGNNKKILYKDNSNKTAPVKINIDEQFIYISFSNNSTQGLYKMNFDGGNLILLSNDDVGDFCIVGDWIFYNNNNDSSIYKIKKDGSNREEVGVSVTY